MGVKVKLSDVIDGMEMQSEDSFHFLNKETGEVVFILREMMRIAEDGEEFDHLPDWQQEEAKKAYDLLINEDNYAKLPSSFDIHEYEMMERFCFTVSDEDKQTALLNAIRGKGAFRRFKDAIIELGVRDEWFEYRDQCYKQIAISFCENVGVDYIQ